MQASEGDNPSFCQRAIEFVCFLIVLFQIVHGSVGIAVRMPPDRPNAGFHHHFNTAGWADQRLNFKFASMTFHDRAYPPKIEADGVLVACHYVYPPPAMLMQYGFGVLFAGYAGVVWAALLVAATLACIYLAADLSGLLSFRHRAVVALLAFEAVEHYHLWDLCCMNCNAIYLSLVLGAMKARNSGRPAIAGALIAVSGALKLYSLPIMAWWCLRDRGRLVMSAAITSFALFAVTPATVYGVVGAVELYASWNAALKRLADVDIAHPHNATIIAVPNVLWNLAGRPNGGAAAIPSAVFIAKALWCATLAAYVWAVWSSPTPRGPAFRLLDVGIALLAPTPFSPLLQPHHFVVALAVSMPLLTIAFRRDGLLSGWERFFVAAVVTSAGIADFALVMAAPTLRPPAWMHLSHLLLLVGAAVYVRTLPPRRESGVDSQWGESRRELPIAKSA